MDYVHFSDFTTISSEYDKGELEDFSGFESSDNENFVQRVRLPELKKCCVLLKKLPEYEELQCVQEWSSINKKYKCNKENLNPQKLYLMDGEKNGIPEFNIFDSENLYKCTVCSQNFNHRISLTNHFQVAHTFRPFNCSECCKNFSCYDNFVIHNQSVHPNLKYAEEQYSIDMKPFVSNEKKIKRYKCHLCDREFNHSITLSLHYQNIHKNFKVSDSLDNYNLSGYRKESQLPQFNSQTVAPKKSVLTDILRNLEAKYISTCIDCNSSFMFQNLLEHVNLIHSGKFVYCSCGFKGNFNATLLHSFEMSHLPNELRPIILGSEDGENNLIISLQLKANFPTEPMRNGKQTPYNCKDCFIQFASISHLIKHNNIYHGKIKSFNCLYCDNLFDHEKNLLKHILSVHNQYKAFMCLKCYRTFTLFKNLIHHLRVYHKILEPYEELERERLMRSNNLISAVGTKQAICESTNSCKLRKVENKTYRRKNRPKKISNSKLLLRRSFWETVANNVLSYFGERFNVTCSLCCHKLSFCELDSHIKKVHPEQSVWCTCGFKGELSVVIVHAFNWSHLPSEIQPIILRSETTDFKFDIILVAITDSPVTYPCFKCSKIFVNEKLRKGHYDICKLEKNIFCDICDKSFILFFHLQIHKATTHNFNCLYCDESFDSKSNDTFSKHILQAHKEFFHQQCIINEFDYSSFENQACNIKCNEGYNNIIMNESDLQQTALTESDLYTSTSDNEFEELQLLRSKKCRKCDDTFNTSTQLKVHSRIHAGKKPHLCQCCPEMFISHNLLLKHNLKAHGKFYPVQDQTKKRKYAYRTSNSSDSNDSDESLPQSRVKSRRPHPVKSRSYSLNDVACPFQGNNESQQIILTLSDLSTSSSESEVEETSSLQCKMCDDSFLTSKQFKVHLRLHNGKRPHSCQHCMLTFVSHNLLLKHRLKNHGEINS